MTIITPGNCYDCALWAAHEQESGIFLAIGRRVDAVQTGHTLKRCLWSYQLTPFVVNPVSQYAVRKINHA